MAGLLVLLLLDPSQHLAETLVLDDGRVADAAAGRRLNMPGAGFVRSTYSIDRTQWETLTWPQIYFKIGKLTAARTFLV